MSSDIPMLSDADLLREIERMEERALYYAAAEGDWSKEREEREANAKSLGNARAEAGRRNLLPNAGAA